MNKTIQKVAFVGRQLSNKISKIQNCICNLTLCLKKKRTKFESIKIQVHGKKNDRKEIYQNVNSGYLYVLRLWVIFLLYFSVFFKFLDLIMCYSYNHKFLIVTFDYKCFFLFGLYTNPSPQQLYFKCNSATLHCFVNWVNAVPSQRKLWNYFQFNYVSVQNNFRAASSAESEL